MQSHASLGLSVLDLCLKVSFWTELYKVFLYLSSTTCMSQYRTFPFTRERSDCWSEQHLSKMDGDLEGQEAMISFFCNICDVLWQVSHLVFTPWGK